MARHIEISDDEDEGNRIDVNTRAKKSKKKKRKVESISKAEGEGDEEEVDPLEVEERELEKKREQERRKKYLEEQDRLKNREINRPTIEPFSFRQPPLIDGGGSQDSADGEGEGADDPFDSDDEREKKKQNNQSEEKNENGFAKSFTTSSSSAFSVPKSKNRAKRIGAARNEEVISSDDEEEKLSDDEAGGITKREVQAQILRNPKMVSTLETLERVKSVFKGLKRTVDQGVESVEDRETEEEKILPSISSFQHQHRPPQHRPQQQLQPPPPPSPPSPPPPPPQHQQQQQEKTNPPQPPTPTTEEKRILNIHVVTEAKKKIRFKVFNVTLFSQIAEFACQKENKRHVSFEFDGEAIELSKTPLDYDINEGDQIDARFWD